MTTRTDFARVLLDHLDECPVCGCPRITFGVPAEGACECECHDQRDTLDEMADFLAAIGYGYDFTSDVQTPEALRWPLAHAWYRKDNPGGGDPTPQDYYDQLADELGWGGRD